MFSEQFDIPLEKLEFPLARERGISLFMKRDDLIHPEISGNKWRKLKYNLLKAQSKKKDLIITLGGAFSNHIAATARLGKELNIATKGIIRGEEKKELNPTLQRAQTNGMELEFISREHYAERNEDWFKQEILERHANAYFIPEGGSNYLGMQGCTEILNEIDINFDILCCCAGTGTTASGLAMGIIPNQELWVFPALKGGEFLKDEIAKQIYWANLNEEEVQDIMSKIHFFSDYHFGGFAKYNEELISFMRQFYTHQKIKLDPIYTAKMMYGIIDLINKDKIKEGKKIILLHSGGLQGIKGIEGKMGEKIYS